MTGIAIIGFGEAGQVYAQDLAGIANVRVWDKSFSASTLSICAGWRGKSPFSQQIR
nr:hypothetical protein [Pantoea bituminis]